MRIGTKFYRKSFIGSNGPVNLPCGHDLIWVAVRVLGRRVLGEIVKIGCHEQRGQIGFRMTFNRNVDQLIEVE